MKIALSVALAISFVTVGIAGFSIGLNMGQEMTNHKYKLVLNDEDTDLLFETLDEIVSRGVVND